MASIKRFEDFEAWKKARSLANAVYRLTTQGAFSRDFALRDQVRRAAVSVVSNIAEGFERGGNKEFAQFLALAKGSCGELRAQLYIARDQGYLSQAQFEALLAESMQVSRMIAALMQYLQQSEDRGNKFKKREASAGN